MTVTRLNQFSITMIALFAGFLGLAMDQAYAFAAEPRHEKIEKARSTLHDAYKELDKASDDFDGHKKEAMEKISEADKSLEKWHDNIKEAKERVDKALEQLHICKDQSRVRHPRIEDAIEALESAKDELK